jgi:hypothetical protein
MKKCEYCKRQISDDKFRCDVCQYAYTMGFENGKASARREIGDAIIKCLDASHLEGTRER